MPVKRHACSRPGVYCIINTENDMIYVGSGATKSGAFGRIKGHLKELLEGTHFNRYLQRAWDSYGVECFVFLIIEFCEPEDCLEREQYWMDYHKSYDRDHGYNICPKAGSRLGVKEKPWTEERRAAHSKILKGKVGYKWTEEEKLQISKTLTGRKQSEETKQKRIKSCTGKKRSPETKRKISEAIKRAWAEKRFTGFTGMQHTEERNQKLSEKHKGKYFAPKSKQTDEAA